MATKTVIVDLDGTLADVRHRLHHIAKGRQKDWPAFFAAMHLDPVNDWYHLLVRLLHREGLRIAIVSGRPDDYAMEIREWLRAHAVPFDALYLRKSGDFRPDTIVKKELLDAHFRKEDVLFVLDDRQSVVDMWLREGLVCLQANPHE